MRIVQTPLSGDYSPLSDPEAGAMGELATSGVKMGPGVVEPRSQAGKRRQVTCLTTHSQAYLIQGVLVMVWLESR